MRAKATGTMGGSSPMTNAESCRVQVLQGGLIQPAKKLAGAKPLYARTGMSSKVCKLYKPAGHFDRPPCRARSSFCGNRGGGK